MSELRGFGPHAENKNPCVRVFGIGPEGARCKDCRKLATFYRAGRRYHKCVLRRISRCEATDHRLRWDACAKYEPGRVHP